MTMFAPFGLLVELVVRRYDREEFVASCKAIPVTLKLSDETGSEKVSVSVLVSTLSVKLLSIGGMLSRTKSSTSMPVLSGVTRLPETSVKAPSLNVMKQLPRDVHRKGLSLILAMSILVSSTVTISVLSPV